MALGFNYQALPDIFGPWNSQTYATGQQMMGMDMQKGQQDLESGALRNLFESQNNPIRLRQAGLNADLDEARLPGVRADASLAQDKANLSRSTYDQQLQELIGSYKGKANQRELDEITRAGQIYSQGGAKLDSMVGLLKSHDQAKQLLGPYWDETLRQVPIEHLGATIKGMGEAMNSAAMKYQQAMMAQNDKQAFQEAENQKKLEAQAKLESLRNAVKEAVAKAKAKASNDPKTLEAVLSRIMVAAQSEKDADRKKVLLEQAQEIENIIFANRTANVVAGQGGKPNVGELGDIPVNPPAQPPQIVTPPPAAASQPKLEIKSLADLQKVYPGVPPEKLRELYKKKFGVDLK